MKCQKCGAEMTAGHLYCDICGAEYQIVPDFEPEIEYSIAESMSKISKTFEKEKVTKEDTSAKKYNTPPFFLVLFLVIFCSVFVFWGYHKYTHSTNYLSKQAVEAMQMYDYYRAAQIYGNIRKENKQNAAWYIKEAEIRMLMAQEEQAKELAVLGTKTKENTDVAYEFLLTYFKENENYTEMNQYLMECPYENIKEKYKKYMSNVPKLNYEGGSYEDNLELSFEKGYHGNIYYTLDGSLPNNKSLKYEKCIKLGNGKHILTAVYENEFGVISEPCVWEYEISSKTPMAPEISVSSGKYAYAEMIEVFVEEGTKVYYTTDLTHPTLESKEYTGPIPMPLGESRFNFIAFSEDGIGSVITQRNFMLNIKTNVSIEEAENMLIQRLITDGHILDQNGAVQDRYGVLRYFYTFPISEDERNYYVFEEHYMENQINNSLGHFYAVDVLDGMIYKLVKDEAGNFIRME